MIRTITIPFHRGLPAVRYGPFSARSHLPRASVYPPKVGSRTNSGKQYPRKLCIARFIGSLSWNHFPTFQEGLLTGRRLEVTQR